MSLCLSGAAGVVDGVGEAVLFVGITYNVVLNHQLQGKVYYVERRQVTNLSTTKFQAHLE